MLTRETAPTRFVEGLMVLTESVDALSDRKPNEEATVWRRLMAIDGTKISG
jgi:hypothetical protein